MDQKSNFAHERVVYETPDKPYGLYKFSWLAIVAGALVAIGLSFLISLFSEHN
jgi:hypothetical protein